jgi:hypothetical protein
MNRAYLAALFLVVAGAFAAYAATRPSSAPSTQTQPATQSAAPFDSLAYCDIRGMAFGVHEIWLYGDGKLVVQVSDMLGRMKRYESKAADAEVQSLQALLVKHNFAELTVQSTNRIPDEGHATITLKPKSGAVHSVEKWDNAKSEGFSAIAVQLMALSKRAESTTPVSEGKYDGHFAPRDEPKPKDRADP